MGRSQTWGPVMREKRRMEKERERGGMEERVICTAPYKVAAYKVLHVILFTKRPQLGALILLGRLIRVQ